LLKKEWTALSKGSTSGSTAREDNDSDNIPHRRGQGEVGA